MSTRKFAYVAGKIGNLPEAQYRAKFATAAMEIESLGFVAVLPIDQPHAHDKSWQSYMKEDITEMLKCNVVYACYDWRDSPGATIEVTLALSLGIPVIYQDFYKEILKVEYIYDDDPVIKIQETPKKFAEINIHFMTEILTGISKKIRNQTNSWNEENINVFNKLLDMKSFDNIPNAQKLSETPLQWHKTLTGDEKDIFAFNMALATAGVKEHLKDKNKIMNPYKMTDDYNFVYELIILGAVLVAYYDEDPMFGRGMNQVYKNDEFHPYTKSREAFIEDCKKGKAKFILPHFPIHEVGAQLLNEAYHQHLHDNTFGKLFSGNFNLKSPDACKGNSPIPDVNFEIPVIEFKGSTTVEELSDLLQNLISDLYKNDEFKKSHFPYTDKKPKCRISCTLLKFEFFENTLGQETQKAISYRKRWTETGQRNIWVFDFILVEFDAVLSEF